MTQSRRIEVSLPNKQGGVMNLKILGIDIAKNVFRLRGVDGRGHDVYRRKVYRGALLSEIANLKTALSSSKNI